MSIFAVSMLDWNKLKPYKTSKERSFEQLCFQIASRLYNLNGRFTPIDDSGGGDGVEFYITLPDGDEWGWQCKFYEGNARLNESNRKSSIIGSLKRSIEKHPRLSKWFLCLPLDPTVDETAWINNTLVNHVPAEKKIEIIPWTHSIIHDFVNRQEFNGIWQAFFNSLELNADWFKRSFDKTITLVKNKFDELLYVPNKEFEYYKLNPALCNARFRARIQFYDEHLQNLFDESLELLADLEHSDNRFNEAFTEYQKAINDFNNVFLLLQPKLSRRYELVHPNSVGILSPKDFKEEVDKLKNCAELADNKFSQNISSFIKEEEETGSKVAIRYYGKKSEHESKCKDLIREIEYYIRDMGIPNKKQINHFLGDGGAGKTNLCVALVKDHTDGGLPALYIPALKITGSNPLADQILRLFDIRQEYSFSQFLDTIDILGHVHNIRVPIVIDGLNEAVAANGTLNKLLREDLPQLELDIRARPNLVLITTCRRTYSQFFWDDANLYPSDKFHALDGFTNHDDTKELTKKYFTAYKIQADLSFNSLIQFRKPIYIKIFCEVTNPDKVVWKEISLGYHSIYTTFEKYTELSDKKIFRKLTDNGKPPLKRYKNLASSVTAALASDLWQNPRRRIDLETMSKMADPDGIDNFEQSVTKAVLDEELLFTRDFGSDNEHIYLTYDLMSGYFIAKHILQATDDFKLFFNSNEGRRLTEHRHNANYPVFEDVLTALCTLLPVKKGLFLHEIIDHKDLGRERSGWLFTASLKATLLLPAEFINEQQFNRVKDLLSLKDNFIGFFEQCEPVLFLSAHPFNFSFFEEYLIKLPANRRDITWTEYLRGKGLEYHQDLINDYEELLSVPVRSLEQNAKLKLIVTYFMWNLTSTDATVKKLMSQALYDYAAYDDLFFFDMYKRSISINDPTIFEWMSVIGYNIVLKKSRLGGNFREHLKPVADHLNQTIFSKKSDYNTSHLLTRDYAYRTLEILYEDDKQLLQIESEFYLLGIQDWKTSPDKNEKQYRDGNGLIHHRFEKEKMYPISAGGNEYRPTPVYKERLGNLRWRAYQLGYDFKLFGEPDKSIVRHQDYGQSSEIKRYADKYIDYAYFELLGHLKDLGKAVVTSESAVRVKEPMFDPREARKSETFHIVSDMIDVDVPLKIFCNDSSVPDLERYFNPANFKGKAADWVLLHGFYHQCKEPVRRQIFTYMEAIFLKKEDYDQAITDFPLATNLGFGGSTPYSTNVHGMEIPDGKAIPLNEFTEWYYTMGPEIVDVWYYRWQLYKDGKKLSGSADRDMWRSLEEETGCCTGFKNLTPGGPPPLIRFVGSKDDKISLEKFLTNNDLQMKAVKKKVKEEQDADGGEIEILHAIRFIEGASYPSKNIINHLHLKKGKNDKELIDEEGKIAGIGHYLNNAYVDQENFTYLRRDLLNKYLEDNGLKMLYIISGERDWYPPGVEWDLSRKQREEREWTKHFKVISYP